MPATPIEQVEREIEQLTVYLSAAEDWEPGYRAQPDIFKRLLQRQAAMQRSTRRYLRGLAARSPKYVMWDAYKYLKADDIDIVVSINDGAWDTEAQQFMGDTVDDFIAIEVLGAEAAQVIYKVPIGIAGPNAEIIQQATDYAGTLIRQQLNPTSRELIRKSVATSLKLGETRQAATARLQHNVANLKRADMIAHTETVGAFGRGNLYYAKTAGAVSKVWRTSLGPCPICQDIPKQGAIPIDGLFVAGNGNAYKSQPAHPWCKCRVVYNFNHR